MRSSKGVSNDRSNSSDRSCKELTSVGSKKKLRSSGITPRGKKPTVLNPTGNHGNLTPNVSNTNLISEESKPDLKAKANTGLHTPQ